LIPALYAGEFSATPVILAMVLLSQKTGGAVLLFLPIFKKNRAETLRPFFESN
jgi:hypothetical protein